jgi:hypothetical protein
MEDEI